MNALPRGVSGAPEFNDVFATQARFVWRVLVRLGVQRGDAPDAAQEVFLVVHRRLPDFDPQLGTVQRWLYGICLRVASDYRRRRAHRQETGERELEDLAAVGEPESAVATQRAWQRLAAVLDAIDEAKREVFVLYELEDLPMSEVVALVGCPLQTGYSRLRAARRAVFAAYGHESEP